jgi:hypothetical protein
MEGPHALRQWLSAGDALHAEVRLPQAAGPRDAGCHARAELPESIYFAAFISTRMP